MKEEKTNKKKSESLLVPLLLFWLWHSQDFYQSPATQTRFVFQLATCTNSCMSDYVISKAALPRSPFPAERRWGRSKQEKKPKHSSRNEHCYLNATRLTDLDSRNSLFSKWTLLSGFILLVILGPLNAPFKVLDFFFFFPVAPCCVPCETRPKINPRQSHEGKKHNEEREGSEPSPFFFSPLLLVSRGSSSHSVFFFQACQVK